MRQLRHFMAVVAEGTFTAAARSELIVQSALSTSIRNLERELGADLFDRTGRRVVLTEAGRPCFRRPEPCWREPTRPATRWRRWRV